jgi:hypothetical protein
MLLGAVTALRLHPANTATEKPILGRLGGEPDWIRADETPRCPSCAACMTFIGELEEGYDSAVSANFGGGGRECRGRPAGSRTPLTARPEVVRVLRPTRADACSSPSNLLIHAS